jgi:hypothetical protein
VARGWKLEVKGHEELSVRAPIIHFSQVCRANVCVVIITSCLALIGCSQESLVKLDLTEDC